MLLLLVPCLLDFRSNWAWFEVNFIPAGLQPAEASYVSLHPRLSAFRAVVVRAVWSSKMPLAHTPAVLILLDGLVGVDFALHICLGQVSNDA